MDVVKQTILFTTEQKKNILTNTRCFSLVVLSGYFVFYNAVIFLNKTTFTYEFHILKALMILLDI